MLVPLSKVVNARFGDTTVAASDYHGVPDITHAKVTTRKPEGMENGAPCEKTYTVVFFSARSRRRMTVGRGAN